MESLAAMTAGAKEAYPTMWKRATHFEKAAQKTVQALSLCINIYFCAYTYVCVFGAAGTKFGRIGPQMLPSCLVFCPLACWMGESVCYAAPGLGPPEGGSLPGRSQITSLVGAPGGWTTRPTLRSPPSRPSPLAGLAESCLQWSLCHLETPGYPWNAPNDFSSRTWYRISLAYQNPSTHRPVFAREGHTAAR